MGVLILYYLMLDGVSTSRFFLQSTWPLNTERALHNSLVVSEIITANTKRSPTILTFFGLSSFKTTLTKSLSMSHTIYICFAVSKSADQLLPVFGFNTSDIINPEKHQCSIVALTWEAWWHPDSLLHLSPVMLQKYSAWPLVARCCSIFDFNRIFTVHDPCTYLTLVSL